MQVYIMEDLLVLFTTGTYLRVPELCSVGMVLQTHQTEIQCALTSSEWDMEMMIMRMLTDLPFSFSSLTVFGR